MSPAQLKPISGEIIMNADQVSVVLGGDGYGLGARLTVAELGVGRAR